MSLGRWHKELLPEICHLEPSMPIPSEADLDHEYLEAMLRNGLLADERSISDCWLMPDDLEDRLPLDAPARREIHRRSANRTLLRRTYSWAIPNQAALRALAALAPLVELGAGGGYWAKLLRERGVDIVAYDRWPPPAAGRQGGWARKLWSEVRPGTTDVLAEHRDRTLVLCWPSPGHNEDCWAAELLRRHQVEQLVFIGEAWGGCTGSNAFHQLLDQRFQLIQELKIPRFSGTNDQLWIYRDAK